MSGNLKYLAIYGELYRGEPEVKEVRIYFSFVCVF
jgi:hypothetical protein